MDETLRRVRFVRRLNGQIRDIEVILAAGIHSAPKTETIFDDEHLAGSLIEWLSKNNPFWYGEFVKAIERAEGRLSIGLEVIPGGK